MISLFYIFLTFFTSFFFYLFFFYSLSPTSLLLLPYIWRSFGVRIATTLVKYYPSADIAMFNLTIRHSFGKFVPNSMNSHLHTTPSPIILRHLILGVSQKISTYLAPPSLSLLLVGGSCSPLMTTNTDVRTSIIPNSGGYSTAKHRLMVARFQEDPSLSSSFLLFYSAILFSSISS
ncbi:unnamed protein product [Acanthosepion pharaonis]|uniref:Uncharacterized protein n=1 Tax=Acanthosepion pharaonis TaxID=158019 RepID=A0A812ETJ7_ACAPH|nr:unnamed protein product [Sepia pharaonis]